MTRFNRVALFALIFAPIAAVFAAPPTTRPLAEYVQRHTRSLEGRAFDIWRNPGRFTKNPDIIELPTGRLMLVYSDTERHLSQEDQYLVLLASDDQGKTWRKHGVVDSHDMRKGEERLVTPRLSILKDGRLVVLIDMDDWGHFHEDQPSGIMCYWSTDNGQTWSKPQLTGVKGFEPDRVQDMPDGSLAFAAHVMRGETQEFADVMYVSTDAGKTWSERATIAHEGFYRYCEGAMLTLDGGKEIACILRENHSAGIPGFVTFSKDVGKTWSKPQTLPFHFHRPYAKQLADGRVLVTGRNVLGGLGTFAWVGDLHAEAGTYQIGGPATRFTASMETDALVITNKADEACRYSLMPPESAKSEVSFEARLKVEGPPGVPVAFLSVSRAQAFKGPIVVNIASDGLWITNDLNDESKKIDMTQYRDVKIQLKRGWLQVMVDGKTAFNSCVFWESMPLRDFLSDDPAKRTQFGAIGTQGRSFWQRVAYRTDNPTQSDFEWKWNAADGKWPDQYQRDRLIQIHANPLTPFHRPDHGYTSWLTLKDGRILLVDYTNRDDAPGKSHLVGIYIDPADLRDSDATPKRTAVAPATQPIYEKQSYGGKRTDFEVAGCPAFVIEPTKPAADGSKPWIWYAPTIKRHPAESLAWLVKPLLDRGFYFVGIDVGETFANPKSREQYAEFYRYLTEKRGLAPKVTLLAQSRGGLNHYMFAATHPEWVQCIAGLFPVADLRSFPTLKRAAPSYGLTEDELGRQLTSYNPIDNLGPIAKARIPILLLHGDADTTVPIDANSRVIYDRITSLGGPMKLIVIPGRGHGGDEFFQSQPLLDFLSSGGATLDPNATASSIQSR